jgi:hypothetical protein
MHWELVSTFCHPKGSRLITYSVLLEHAEPPEG